VPTKARYILPPWPIRSDQRAFQFLNQFPYHADAAPVNKADMSPRPRPKFSSLAAGASLSSSQVAEEIEVGIGADEGVGGRDGGCGRLALVLALLWTHSQPSASQLPGVPRLLSSPARRTATYRFACHNPLP